MTVVAYLAELCRLYVSITLAAAALGKATDVPMFGATIRQLSGFPSRMANLVACFVIGIEAAISASLLLGGDWARFGMAAAVVLISIFSAVIVRALAKGERVTCNCFGSRGQRMSVHDLARNGFLVAAGGFYLLKEPGSLTLAAAGSLSGIALILFLISSHLREISSLIRST